jgi:uncharacterized membrane protein YbhN (UPF0104 family)
VNQISTEVQKKVQILRWIGTICTLGLLVYLLQKQGWNEIQEAFQQVSLGRFALGILLIYVSRFAVIGRWHTLLRSVEKVSLWQTTRLTFAGLFAANFLPTTIGGDVVRLTGAVQLKFDGVVAAASLVVDRLIGMFGMFLALPFGAKPLIDWLSITRISNSGIIMGISFSWIPKLWERILDLFQKVFRAVGVWSKHPKSLLLALFFTVIHMICIFGILMLFLNDMGERLSFSLIAGLWSFVYFITLLPISINGIGVQEISMAFIFSEVGGASLESGLTVSVLFRTLMMLGSVPGAFFLPGILAGEKAWKEKET